MEYFVPSSPNSRDGGPAVVPVNPSTVPCGQSAAFPPLPSDWKTRNIRPEIKPPANLERPLPRAVQPVAPPVMPMAPEPVIPPAPEPVPETFPYREDFRTEPYAGGTPPADGFPRYAEPTWPPEETYKPDTEPGRSGDDDGMSLPAVPACGGNPGFGGVMPYDGAAVSPGCPETSDPLLSPFYTSGFLRGQVGRIIRIESLAGSTLTERVGRLLQVGADYILLHSVEGHTVVCDLSAVRFATIVQEY